MECEAVGVARSIELSSALGLGEIVDKNEVHMSKKTYLFGGTSHGNWSRSSLIILICFLVAAVKRP